MRGTPRQLQLLVFLDSTRNAVAIREAYNRNIPTIAVVNTANDMSKVGWVVCTKGWWWWVGWRG
jgi:ribosomal protein S2